MMIASLLVTTDLFLKSIRKAVLKRGVQLFLIAILIFAYLYFVLSFSMNLVGFISYHYAIAIIFYFYFDKNIGKVLMITTPFLVWFYLFLVDLPDRTQAKYLPLFALILFLVIVLSEKITFTNEKIRFYLIYYLTMVISPKTGMIVYHRVDYGWYQFFFVILGSFILLKVFEWLHNLIEREEKQVIDELLNSKRDSLTGVYNFYSFNKDLIIYNQVPLPRTIVMIDLDHFKQINDHYGHLAGNDLLREFAQIIESYLLEKIGNDHYKLYRYGGEEFCIIFEDVSPSVIRRTLEKLRIKINQHTFSIQNYQVGEISFSAGVENCKEEEGSILEALHLADQALYCAKNNGRNQVQYYS